MAKILVIEDDDLIRGEVAQWLEFEDFEVLSAPNGREGIRLATEHLPDLILSDIVMPLADGYRVLLELRIQPATALIPIIFITAKSERSDMRYAMELGADDYLSKPFSHTELLQSIRQRLERQRSIQAMTTQQINDVRQTILRALPHELRTPLVGVLGIGELLVQDARTLQPDDIVEYGELLIGSARRLYHIVENSLLHAKLENAAPVQDPPLPVAEMVYVVESTSAALADLHQRRTDISVDVQKSAISIEADALRKILSELLDNALKFSDKGQSVIVTGKATDAGYVFRIADRGRGMTAEEVERIGPYVQFNRELHEQQGLGLGLSIAQRLAQRAGGSLLIESTPGYGTVVTVTLPQA
ncbi:MAG: HAMP domain-containing histidine kinase [Chloroflexi bacterium]|nr:HAMP domain-containing histidine kinase [Chloroflexota bacterium]